MMTQMKQSLLADQKREVRQSDRQTDLCINVIGREKSRLGKNDRREERRHDVEY